MSDSGSGAVSPLHRIRRRRADGTSSPANRAGGAAGMMRMYTEDTPGIKVDPVAVLVMSLIFIGSVFILHIWGKYTRSGSATTTSA